MATNVEKLILAIETQKFDEAEKQLNKIRKAAEGAGKAQEGLNNETGKGSRVFKGFRGATSALTNTTGQLSVQLQDVAVQAQMGTDGIRILAQQGPQIASIFGPSGAVVGALIAVGAIIAGPFIKSFMQANEEIDKTTKKLDQLKDKIYELSEVQKEARMSSLAVQMRETQSAITATEKSLQESIETNQKFQNSGKDVDTIFYQLKNGVITYEEALNQSSKEVLDARATLERLRLEMNEQLMLSGKLTGKIKEQTEEQKRNAESVEASLEKGRQQVQVLGMSAIQAELFRLQMLGANETQIEARRVQLEATAAFDADQKAKKKADQEEEARKAARKSYIESLELQSQKQGKSVFQQIMATAATKNLNDEEMKRVTIAAVRIQQQIDEQARQKELNDEQRESLRISQQVAAARQREQEALRQAQLELAKAFEDDRNKAIAELRQAGLLEEERLQDLSYQRQLEKLKLFVAQKRITEEEFGEAKKKLDKKTQDAAIKTAADGLQALGQYNKTAFEAHKAYASGKAVMDTYAAATKAFAEIPLPWSIAAAAGIVAMGLANVASIQSQQYQGRALGGQVRGGQTYVVGERGPELLTMGGNGTVTPNEKLRGSTGTQSVSETVNINFQITANDASGFDQLLVARRGMIVSMINQAMNNRGRRGLV
jgi:hypothetical protein